MNRQLKFVGPFLLSGALCFSACGEDDPTATPGPDAGKD